MTPRRVQRKRTPGWRMPDYTKYIGRGTRFGNPYRVIVTDGVVTVEHPTRGTVFESRERLPRALADAHAKAVSDFYRELGCQDDTHDHGLPTLDEVRAELAGKNLACWCPPHLACHADVLLEVANDLGDDGGLFDASAFRAAPEPEVPKGLGVDARRTLRQIRELIEGKHPATKATLHPDAPPADDRDAEGPRCGSCKHLWRKLSGNGAWTKCKKAHGAGDGPDIRQWWPACRLYEENTNAE